MKALKTVIDRALAGLLIVLMGLLVVDVLWQVFSRYVLGAPSSYTEELARFLLIWVGLLGAAYASGRHMHLAVDILPGRLSGNSRHYLELLIHGLVLVFVVSVMVYGGSRLVWVTLYLGQTAAALRMPLGYIYIVLPLSGLLIAFYASLSLGNAWRALTGRPPLSSDAPEEGTLLDVD
jgi:TRAP-type C4-dicarboxylate transport system permease small subunit